MRRGPGPRRPPPREFVSGYQFGCAPRGKTVARSRHRCAEAGYYAAKPIRLGEGVGQSGFGSHNILPGLTESGG